MRVGRRRRKGKVSIGTLIDIANIRHQIREEERSSVHVVDRSGM